MNKIDEQLLQKWEKAPLQYREEIVRTEQQMSDEFCSAVRAGNRYYHIYKAGSPEWMKEAEKDHQFTLVWNRLIKLVTIITRHDTEVSRAQHREYMRKLEAENRAMRRPVAPAPNLKSRRRVVISNNVATLVQAAEQYENQLYLKRFLAVGQA
jgi:hypothetical protein